MAHSRGSYDTDVQLSGPDGATPWVHATLDGSAVAGPESPAAADFFARLKAEQRSPMGDRPAMRALEELVAGLRAWTGTALVSFTPAAAGGGAEAVRVHALEPALVLCLDP